MKTMTARQLKNETGKALQLASRGERVLITRRGRPVAWLVQAEAEEPTGDDDAAWQEIRDALSEGEPAFATW